MKGCLVRWGLFFVDASGSLGNLGWFEVVEERGLIRDGQVAEFQSKIKVGFRLEE